MNTLSRAPDPRPGRHHRDGRAGARVAPPAPPPTAEAAAPRPPPAGSSWSRAVSSPPAPTCRTRPSSRRSTARCRASTSPSIDLVAKDLGVKQADPRHAVRELQDRRLPQLRPVRPRRGRHDHHRGAQEERRLLGPVLRRHPGRPGRQEERASTSLADVKAKKVKLGAQAQTTGEDYVKKQGFDPVSFESSDAVLNGLRTGQVKAVVIDYPVVQGWLKNKANADAFKVVDNLNTGEQYGFTVKKGNTKLLAADQQGARRTPRPTARTRSCTRSGSARTTSPRPPRPPPVRLLTHDRPDVRLQPRKKGLTRRQKRGLSRGVQYVVFVAAVIALRGLGATGGG